MFLNVFIQVMVFAWLWLTSVEIIANYVKVVLFTLMEIGYVVFPYLKKNQPLGSSVLFSSRI